MWSKILSHFLFVLVITCPVAGQVKKQLTEADYKLWSTLETNQLSEKGSWVSYSLYYEESKDTLFVRNTSTLKTFAFAGGTGGRFVKDNFFVVRANNGDIVLTDLNKGTERQFSNISTYSIALNGQLLVMLKSDGSISGDLLVVGTDGTELLKLPNVSLYSLNPDNTKLVCDSDRKLHLLDLKKLSSVALVDAKERSYVKFAWQNNGTSCAWFSTDESSAVGQYRITEGIHYIFYSDKFNDFLSAAEISNTNNAELSISDDGNRVFFFVTEKKSIERTKGVQVWNTADKVLYAARAAFGDSNEIPKLAVWTPNEQKFRMVTNNQFPNHILMPGQQNALVYDRLENEPQFDSDAPIDYYLQNIVTGAQHLLLANHSSDLGKIEFSNTGKYVAYFKDKQWWIYDIHSSLHRNLTSKINGKFTNEKYDRSGEEKISGIAGWTSNDKELLVYDHYDIWSLKTDGNIAERLTNGREQGIVYRLVSKSPYGATGSAANGILNLNDGLLLQATSDKKSGYSIWRVKRGLHEIVFENNRIGSLKHSNNGSFIYTRENYYLSPQLVYKFGRNKPKVVYQSNPQQNNFDWGFSKLISYENSKDQFLNGALFYPAGYNADKKYPMIVHIYERQADLHNQYINPTLFNTDGFNISNFTTQGYFVLLPDIAYVEGQTGSSAVDCVISAVDEVLKHESVDVKRLGLYGHSFGGYETNFIITQINKFAAAVSGAGISDIVSSYLTVGPSNKKADGWRYEFNQFRMGTSLFDDYQKYLQNSPITFVNQIMTPLLLWCGEKDSAINYSQSMEMYLALRRLQKPNIFLLYENGGHAIMQKEDQIDLTHRMQGWFDFYLKEGIRPDWFQPDRL